MRRGSRLLPQTVYGYYALSLFHRRDLASLTHTLRTFALNGTLDALDDISSHTVRLLFTRRSAATRMEAAAG